MALKLSVLGSSFKIYLSCHYYFFFSSRRRHTRFDCDWSSDVCSSDLVACGLASRVVPDDQLDAAVTEQVGRLKELAPWGLAMTKEMLNRGASTDYSTAKIGRASCRERV